MKKKLSTHIIQYFSALEPYCTFEDDIEWLQPYSTDKVMNIVKDFYGKYYADNEPRTLILGINPGRYGAGITGIPFTDPVNLETHCGIDNEFEKKEELSSKFVYKIIEAYGGTEKFYKNFFISSVSPLGFVKAGKNFNYYDSSEVFNQLKPHLRKHMKWHFKSAISDNNVINWGKGKNKSSLENLYTEQAPYDTLINLPHPRWIMQYRRKSMEKWINTYLEDLTKAHEQNLSTYNS